MHLGDCNKEDLHKKPLLLFFKVDMTVYACSFYVCLCVCVRLQSCCSVSLQILAPLLGVCWAIDRFSYFLSHLSFGFCINTYFTQNGSRFSNDSFPPSSVSVVQRGQM